MWTKWMVFCMETSFSVYCKTFIWHVIGTKIIMAHNLNCWSNEQHYECNISIYKLTWKIINNILSLSMQSIFGKLYYGEHCCKLNVLFTWSSWWWCEMSFYDLFGIMDSCFNDFCLLFYRLSRKRTIILSHQNRYSQTYEHTHLAFWSIMFAG